jgi:hypothetical protein
MAQHSYEESRELVRMAGNQDEIQSRYLVKTNLVFTLNQYAEYR